MSNRGGFQTVTVQIGGCTQQAAELYCFCSFFCSDTDKVSTLFESLRCSTRRRCSVYTTMINNAAGYNEATLTGSQSNVRTTLVTLMTRKDEMKVNSFSCYVSLVLCRPPPVQSHDTLGMMELLLCQSFLWHLNLYLRLLKQDYC